MMLLTAPAFTGSTIPTIPRSAAPMQRAHRHGHRLQSSLFLRPELQAGERRLRPSTAARPRVRRATSRCSRFRQRPEIRERHVRQLLQRRSEIPAAAVAEPPAARGIHCAGATVLLQRRRRRGHQLGFRQPAEPAALRDDVSQLSSRKQTRTPAAATMSTLAASWNSTAPIFRAAGSSSTATSTSSPTPPSIRAGRSIGSAFSTAPGSAASASTRVFTAARK